MAKCRNPNCVTNTRGDIVLNRSLNPVKCPRCFWLYNGPAHPVLRERRFDASSNACRETGSPTPSEARS